MGRFLAIFNGAADEADKAEVADLQQSEFMSAWAAWAQSHQSAIVELASNVSKMASFQRKLAIFFTSDERRNAVRP